MNWVVAISGRFSSLATVDFPGFSDSSHLGSSFNLKSAPFSSDLEFRYIGQVELNRSFGDLHVLRNQLVLLCLPAGGEMTSRSRSRSGQRRHEASSCPLKLRVAVLDYASSAAASPLERPRIALLISDRRGAVADADDPLGNVAVGQDRIGL